MGLLTVDFTCCNHGSEVGGLSGKIPLLFF